MAGLHRLLARRIRRWTSLCVCFGLVFSAIAGFPFHPASSKRSIHVSPQEQEGNERRVAPLPPRTGPPAPNLPNLDEVKLLQIPAPRAADALPSTMRSPRKPLESRNGRTVSDPLPPLPTPTALATPTVLPSPTPLPTPLLELAKIELLMGDSLYWPLFRYLNEPFGILSPLSDSSMPLFLTRNTTFDVTAAPIPQASGAKIVFASSRDGFVQIYVMNSDGTGQTRLTTDGSNNENPRWSPNGTKILFQSDRDNPGSGFYDIYVMNADGSGQTRLTTDANDDRNASWSGDGAKIVFQSLRNGVGYQIYTMNADGSGQINISNTAASETQPSWSSDNAKIVFASDRDQVGFPSIYSMNANGTGQARLTFSGTGFKDEQPVWSPDRTKIVFVTTRDSTTDSWIETDDYEIPEDDGQTFPKSRLNVNKEVYVMNASGTGQTRLTNNLSNDDSACWSPDGTKIVFRSERERDLFDTTPQIWTMNADGTNQTNLSNSGDGDSSPSWTSGSGNQTPVANAGGPYSGVVSQNAPFSGSGSFDPDGSIVNYAWTFGDGGTGSGVAPTHAYGATGTYTVMLTVTDNLGAQASASTAISISASTSDQYVTSFLQWGLGRVPTGAESTYWTDIIRAAYPQGLPSMQLAMRELGMTVFESAEYAALSRNDHWYVYDLYKTFLMRDPDTEGWANWEAAIPIYGREQVRRAFDESTEFANIVATLNASGSPSVAVSSLATARVDLFNESGNQLQARDAEWSVSLLSLPGRAGLDLGLGLSYSSLVWTNSGPYMYFDADRGSPSPGFHIGFPTIQDKFFDARVGKNVYLLKTAAGHKVELRQVGTSNTYESADTSYLQLIAGGTLQLRSTDGTTLTFSWTGLNEYRCTSIEDRNGNYMVVNYDWRGDIQNVTDTLGRVITFVYDTNANLNRIEQTWAGQPEPHRWASFGWDNLTIQPSVTGIVGTHSGEVIPVLKMVSFDDSTYTKFLHNGNGLIERITQYASDSDPNTDNHPRNYTIFDYDSATADCPRLISTRTSAEYWTGLNGVPTEVTTQFGIEGDKHTMSVLGDPNGTIYKETYAGSGDAAWMRGLLKSSEVWAGGTQQKVSTHAWTQENTSVVYKMNPRVIETNVYDSVGNHRRVTIDYSNASYAQYGLPYIVREYAADATTILRETYTDYKLDQPYIDGRIIGLVAAVHLVSSSYQAKVTYGYDDPARLNGQATTSTMHYQNYDGYFTIRGNVTSVSRWDVTDITNSNKALTSTINYNAAGSAVSTTDPAGHTRSISYADSFSDGNNGRNTFAYPTTLTDADGFSSSVQYNFDFGAKTRMDGPPPQSQPQGAIQFFTYDGAARLQQVTTQNNGAYIHYDYGPNYIKSYSSVNNVAGNYLDSDLYSITVFDGAGRGFTTTTNHPGSAGGYKLVNVIFDRMGQPFLQSNPTEVNSSWLPAGDDAYNPTTGEGGVRYSLLTFDWKGRTKRKTHPDGAYSEANYAGCGCAGGEVVTMTDEMNRQQKVYSDVLGRTWKTEAWTWPDASGNRSVYSAKVNVYGARDQILLSNQYAGGAPTDASSTNTQVSCPSGTCQQTSMGYDGYGRLQSKHIPEQDAGTATTWTYNVDNTIHSITDARGATATYTYNNGRHLVNLIEYTAPTGVTTTANVSFGYDAAGNRTSMTDGMGTQSYSYDSLSRMTSETRYFGSPLNQSFTLSYDYNFAGQLKTMSDPWGGTLNYGFDSIGRLNNIGGSGYGSVSQFTSNMQYRAWGTLKAQTYGNGLTDAVGYNARMQVTSFELRKPTSELQIATTTQFYPDGQVKFSHNALDERFDRAFAYDHMGRTNDAFSGSEARDFINNTNSGTTTGPYRQSYEFNAFSNVTQQINRFWSVTQTTTNNFTNNRLQDWVYDAAGFVVNDGTFYTRDAAGRHVAADNEYSHAAYGFDGDGRMLKAVRSRPSFNGNTITTTTYYLNSIVLGRLAVAELNATGQKTTRYIYAGARKLAEEANGAVTWAHQEPVMGSRGASTSEGGYYPQAEFNADGINVGFYEPIETGFEVPEPIADFGLLALGSHCSNADPNCQTCYLDGFETDCGRINWEASEQCPNNDCGPRRVPDANGNSVLVPLTRNPNSGILGYWPDGYNAPGILHDSMGRAMTVTPFSLMSAPAGGGTAIYDRFYTEAIYNGQVVGGWQYYVVGYTTPIELSTSFEPQKTPIDPNILDRTDALLKKQKCKDFLNAMLKELGRITGRGRDGVSFEELFNAARGSISSSPDLNSRGNAGQKLIGDPGLSIEILIRPRVPTDAQSAPTTIMHEIFHDAPSAGAQYTHTQMVRAAFAVADAMGMTKDHDYPLQLGQQPKLVEGTDDEKRAADNWNSSLFQQILDHACR